MMRGGNAGGSGSALATLLAAHSRRIPMTNAARTGRSSILEDRRHSRSHRLGERRGIPVRHPDATVRLRLADRRRVRGPVNPVMRYRQVDPDDADRVVGTGRNLRFLLARGRVPEEFGVVMEGRVPGHTVDLPG